MLETRGVSENGVVVFEAVAVGVQLARGDSAGLRR